MICGCGKKEKRKMYNKFSYKEVNILLLSQALSSFISFSHAYHHPQHNHYPS